MNEAIYKTHELKLINRDILSFTGIKKVANFDVDEFLEIDNEKYKNVNDFLSDKIFYNADIIAQIFYN